MSRPRYAWQQCAAEDDPSRWQRGGCFGASPATAPDRLGAVSFDGSAEAEMCCGHVALRPTAVRGGLARTGWKSLPITSSGSWGANWQGLSTGKSGRPPAAPCFLTVEGQESVTTSTARRSPWPVLASSRTVCQSMGGAADAADHLRHRRRCPANGCAVVTLGGRADPRRTFPRPEDGSGLAHDRAGHHRCARRMPEHRHRIR